MNFGGTVRFRVERPIGSGGMGVVYEATDLVRGTRVALKTLRNLDPSSVIRFKDEFRALADIHHENLVRFDELSVEGAQYFFTMELLHGKDLLAYVRPGRPAESTLPFEQIHVADTVPASEVVSGVIPSSIRASQRVGKLDEARLRLVLTQLARGLSTLHAAGKIHRDIKPTNVIVEGEGEHARVVIVDFGLVTEANERSDGVAGTLVYMAPEQAGGVVGPAADWYAVGVMLYEALTGQIPFFGSAFEVLETKRNARPPRASEAEPGAPPDLDELAAALMDPDPRARPDDEEVLRRLGVKSARPSLMPPSTGANTPPFIGRRQELEQLQLAYDQARRGSCVSVCIQGESGLGKTALARHFLAKMEKADPHVIVLRGRCYERESVPYKAVDGVIDALGRWLMRRPRAELLALVPDSAVRLARAFPALARLASLPLAHEESVRSSELDATLRRMRLFHAMRELLHALAAERLVVLLIDDLQWADADSLLLLREVMRAPPAALLLVATLRSDRETQPPPPAPGDPPTSLPASRFQVGTLMPGDARVIDLEPLGPDEGTELAALLIERARAAGATESAAEGIAREAAGHPLFIDELVRHVWEPGASSGRLRVFRLEDALWARIHATDEGEQRLLFVLALARGPLSFETTAAACEIVNPGDLDDRVAKLRFERLVRTTRVGERAALEVFHNRVRQAVLAHLGDGREVHARIAAALEATNDADLEARAEHHRGAGDLAKASTYALRAAEIAISQLAFDRAARLFEWTFAMRPEAANLETLRDFGHALACAGRGKAAADAYLRAATLAPDRDTALDLRRRAAHNLLTTGHTREGMTVLEDVLRALDVKLSSTRRGTAVSLALRRAHLRLRGLRFRRPATADPDELARVDAVYTASAGMAFVDTLRGAELQTRALLLALQAGEPSRVASALTNEAAYAAVAGERGLPRSTRLLHAARALAEESKSQRALGHVLVGEGISLHLAGYWSSGRVRCQEGLRVLREHSPESMWEIDAALIYWLRSLFMLGQIAFLRTELPEQIADAEARGDRFALTSLRGGDLNAVWLVLGDTEMARRELEESRIEPAEEGALPHVQDVIARARIDLYEGNGARAVERLEEAWTHASRTQLTRIHTLRISLLSYRARAALARSRGARNDRAFVLQAAQRTNELARCGDGWALAEAALLRGCIGQALGDAPRAAISFERAIRDFTACDMGLHAAVARLRFGKLVSGDEGRAAVSQARAWCDAQGIADPESVAAVLAP